MSQGGNFPPHGGFDLHRSVQLKMHGFPTQKNSGSDEDEPSFTEDGNNFGKSKVLPWHRVKWSEKMIRLLITAVSYIGDEVASESGKRKCAMLQKKGKWKSVSKVMAERGFHVSPQQCEDKFNDLNKRYKKLNDMLGRGTSCEVVENPLLLNVIEFLSEKEKDEVRKILSSKHLFYEEMCSYHNGNRLHLPHDPALQRSLQLALKSSDDDDYDDNDDGDKDGDGDGNEGGFRAECEENRACVVHTDMVKRKKHDEGNESRAVRLEEQKLQYRLEVLELQRQRLKWERICRKRDMELEKMRMENEKMKLENEQIALELKRKELGENSNYNIKLV